jgi:hypothetical protein
MAKSINNIIQFLRKRIIGIVIAAILFISSFIPGAPSWIAEVLRGLTGLVFGIVLYQEWQSKVIEKERREERIKVIEEFTGLQRLGLKKVLPERDSDERNKKTFDFLKRFEEFQPRSELIIIGITVNYLPEELPDQVSSLLRKYPNMTLKVCVLDPDSPCVSRRSQEVHRENEKTRKRIHDAIDGWKKLKKEFPHQIILKKSKAIPYGEYEGVDINKNRGVIYYTPLAYKAHTNVTPSFVFSPQTVLYDFHKKVITEILNDAEDI